MRLKGSKKHVLDLIDSNDFIDTLNAILLPYNSSVTDKKTVQPKGKNDASECGLQSYLNKHSLAEQFPSLKDVNCNFNKWWKPCGGKAPTWDLISLCQLDGKDAILLVEAKAHVKEFDVKGKRFKDKPSDGAITNHNNIEARIKKACGNLNCTYAGFDISIEKHYQLSNRVAFAWQLKQLNVPVVLLYLGFTGDSYFTDYFEGDSHWEEEFNKYIDGVVPRNFINKKESDFLFIHSSLEIK
ncbi:hypothetical protein [Flavobacterium sp. HJJ]|uniref:hypothetical protein n=1 Tax=Flavobacterium sp. HJJ TaxID=2783792 RepID=UPI00188CF568|nr:hypothetical protein [Flavobacterium sp. HJJ]MBF4472610.1 hypothetical protein [Flavobacterium sp. HJJ]